MAVAAVAAAVLKAAAVDEAVKPRRSGRSDSLKKSQKRVSEALWCKPQSFFISDAEFLFFQRLFSTRNEFLKLRLMGLLLNLPLAPLSRVVR